MKLKLFKSSAAAAMALAFGALSIPYTAYAADTCQQGKTSDGYDYELWNQNGQGQASMQLGSNGGYSCSWGSIQNVLFRTGKKLGSTQSWQSYNGIKYEYDVDYTPRGNSYMCVYGWTEDPTVEYYIVEAWGDWRPPGSNNPKATINVDGKSYDLFTSTRVNQPSIHGNETFEQYWSVRTTNDAAVNQTKNLKGTITVSDHFAAWEQAGMKMGKMYEVAFNIEGYMSSGEANVKTANLILGGGGGNSAQQTAPAATQPAQQNNDWNNWNNNDWNNQNNNQQNNDWNNQNNNQQNNDWNNWNNNNNNNGGDYWNNWYNFDWNNYDWNNWGWNNWNDWSNNNSWNSQVSTWGDTNQNGQVDLGDAVAVMQSLANPDKYQLDDQSRYNGDVYQAGTGITNQDAVAIQGYLLDQQPNLPVSFSTNDQNNNWNNNQQNNDWNNWNNNDWNNQNNNQQNNDWNNWNNNDWNNQNNNQQNNDWNNWNNNDWNNQNTNSAAVGGGQTYSVGNGMNQHKGDNVDGYSYEIWLDQTGGSGSMTLGSGGAFNTEWSAQVSSGNFLARRGRNYDASKKATQYGPIVMDYAADYSASSQGNSRLCVYSWMKDPLVEYYIIEDWVNWCPSANGQSKTVTIDGAEYEIFQLDHTGPTILGDTRTFKQYFSVRKSKRTSGTITVSDHFKAWENAGWNIGNLTEVALNVEGWESSGKANVSKLTISEGSGSSNNQQSQQTSNNQQNNDWNNWGQSQQNNDWSNWGQPANTNVQVGGVQDFSGKKLVAIAFDDGASATSRSDPAYIIMDALIENNFHATFFYVSDWIKTNEQVQFAYKNGMEVANHTKSHQSLGSLDANTIRSEWEQCNSKLRSIIGAEPSHIMRLPYLDGGGQVKTALYDVPLISCGVDTQDWNGASADQIVNTLKSAAQNGTLQNQIVLCHENYASTAQAMETVLPWLKQNGWEVVTVSDMFAANGKQLQGGQIYTRS
ncbi:MAG: glycoside hydrolase family 11 protein [Ruminococcus sp.]|nr:glycoside hydrolase family 11 protein [Ruminococcus sp.]